MDEILQMIGLGAVVFGLSMGLSYLITYRRRVLPIGLPVEENTSCRLVGPGGDYRSYYLRATRKGLVFSAPLHRDNFVPLRVGEKVMVQAPAENAIITFRTEIVGRDPETHEFLLAKPERIRRVDRRAELRDTTLAGEAVEINQEPGELVDLSAYGAKILTATPVLPGDTVRLELPFEYGTAYGWILEATPAAFGPHLGHTVRIKFNAPLSGMVGRKNRRLYISP